MSAFPELTPETRCRLKCSAAQWLPCCTAAPSLTWLWSMNEFHMSLRLNMQRLWRRIAAFLLGSFLPFLSPSSYLPPSHPCHSQAFRVFLKAWLVLINTHTKGEINCPVYDCFYYLAGGRHDQNHHKYSFKKSIAMHPPDYFSPLLGTCDTVKPQYAEEIQHQQIHSKGSAVYGINVCLRIMVETDTCTLCPILLSGMSVEELLLTAGDLHLGAGFFCCCSRVHLKSHIQLCRAQYLRIGSNILNLIRAE